MFGGGLDKGVNEYLMIDQLQIPYMNKEDFQERIMNLLEAEICIVVEKDTIFNRLIQSPILQEHRDRVLMITVSNY